MPAKDILQPIPTEQLTELRELFNNNYGKHIYYFIDNYITWLKKKLNTKIQFLCPNGDWRSDGTFVAIVEETLYSIILFTLDKTNNRLEKALKETNLIKWKHGPLINFVHSDHLNIIDNVVKYHNLSIVGKTYSNIYRLDADKARNIEFSHDSDVYIDNLTTDHVSTINAKWTYRNSSSEKYIQQLIDMNGGIGLFGKVDNKLRAWALINDNGGLGMLYTMDEYRRKGYAKIVVKVFSKQFGQQNKDIIVFTSQTNSASRRLFESCGFQFINYCRWIYILDTITYKNATINWK